MKATFLIILCLVLSIPGKSTGQNLSLKDKKQICNALVEAIAENYILQDSVEYIKARLKESYKSEDFKKEQDKSSFAYYLTGILRTVTKDAHFLVRYDPTLFKSLEQIRSGGNGTNTGGIRRPNGLISSGSKENFFFRKAEVLDGNIGYLKIAQIPALEDAKPTVDAAMAFLANSDAFILDLRANGGGIGGFIPYLMSYFFPKDSILLYKREMTAWDSTSYHYTYKELPGKRFDKKPIYILIDQFTGSAATNLAYTMQSFNRAVLIGENTGSGYRGAHSAGGFPLEKDIVALIPIGRVVNARTHTNWRDKGVEPDVSVASEDALLTAHKLSLQKLIETEDNEDLRSELKKILIDLDKNKDDAVPEANEDMSAYAAVYGNTVITYEDGKLFFKRPEVPYKLPMKRKKDEVFEVVLPKGVRGSLPDLRFNREQDKIISLTMIRDGKDYRTEQRNTN